MPLPGPKCIPFNRIYPANFHLKVASDPDLLVKETGVGVLALAAIDEGSSGIGVALFSI